MVSAPRFDGHRLLWPSGAGLLGARSTPEERVDSRRRVHAQLRELQPHPRTSRLFRLTRLPNPAHLSFDQQRLAQTRKREPQRDAVSWAPGLPGRHENSADAEVLGQPSMPTEVVFHINGHRELPATSALHQGHARRDRSAFPAPREMVTSAARTPTNDNYPEVPAGKTKTAM